MQNQQIGINKKFSVTRSQKNTSRPVTTSEMELLLLAVLKEMKENNILTIFFFDELDKLGGFNNDLNDDSNEYHTTMHHGSTEGLLRLSSVEELFGKLKNFVSHDYARHIFVAGREVMDSFLSERANTDSLYETFFDQTFEVNSLLSDNSDDIKDRINSMVEVYLCSKINKECVIDNEIQYKIANLWEYRKLLRDNYKPKQEDELNRLNEVDYIVYVLRNFVNYLAFYSWGNPKRLMLLFENFVVSDPKGKNYYLSIKCDVIHQLIFSSHMMTTFQHHLSRKFSQSNDKLIVTTFSALHYILKFHKYAFSRESFYRMSEAINVHRSPEFNDVVDGLLSLVTPPFTRRIRNGSFRYRFLSGFEQEIRFLTYKNDIESSAFNFSLNQMTKVKTYYKSMLGEYEKSSIVGRRGYAKYHLILADIFSLEEEFDQANWHFTKAMEAIRPIFFNKDNNEPIHNSYFEDETILVWIEAMLKSGDLEERRRNYHKAAAIYLGATKLLGDILESNNICENIIKNDSKWELFREPFWAYQFLALKRSYRVAPEAELKTQFCFDKFYDQNDARYKLKQGILLFFLGDPKPAKKYFRETINDCKKIEYGERRSFLEGTAMVKLVESHLIDNSLIIVDTYLNSASTIYKNKSKIYMVRFFGDMANPTKVERLLDYLENKGITNFPTQHNYGSEDFYSLFITLLQASSIFRSGGLALHASIGYMRALFYFSMVVDFIKEQDEYRNPALTQKYEKLRSLILKKAIDNIHATRRVKSSHFISTFVYRDLTGGDFSESDRDTETVTKITDVTDFFKNKTYVNNPLFWQQTILYQKIQVAAIWMQWMIEKTDPDFNSENSILEKIDVDNIAPFSVRYKIVLRWLTVRYRIEKLQKTLVGHRREHKENNIQDVKQYFHSLIDDYRSDIEYILKHTMLAMEEIWHFTYNEQDLVFPMMTQLSYLNWKILYILANEYNKSNPNNSHAITALSKILQYALLSEFRGSNVSPDKQEPSSISDVQLVGDSNNFINQPSLLDILQVKDKALSYLNSIRNVVDPTSKAKTNILQNKYYGHDDYLDPEFNLDWTLLQMFSPNAKLLRNNITEKMKKLGGDEYEGQTDDLTPEESRTPVVDTHSD